MVLLVVGRVVLAAPAGLPATPVRWLRVATGSAHARATSGLRPTRHLAAFRAAWARAWALLRPGPGASGGWRRRAAGLWRGGRHSAGRRRWRRRSGGSGCDGGRRGRGGPRARRGAGGRGIGGRGRAGGRRRRAHSGRSAGAWGDDGLGRVLRRRRGLLMGRLMRRRLLVRRGLLRRGLLRRRLLLLLVRRRRRDRWLRAARARAHGAAVLVKAHAGRR